MLILEKCGIIGMIRKKIDNHRSKGRRMNTENNYSGMPRSKTDNEIRYFLRKRKEVPVNTLLIVVNLLVFLLVEITGSSLDSHHILHWGGCYTPAVLQQHEYYRLISSMFLHFGIQHLGNNMLVLLFLGDCLERNIGKIKYLLIYFLGGIGANILSIYLEIKNSKYFISAGASGAVFAVMGALIYIVIANRGRIENFTTRQLIVMAGLSLYFGMTSTGVDNAAHFSGLISGFFLSVLFYRRVYQRRL